MSIDLSKLPPAPWRSNKDSEDFLYVADANGKTIGMPEFDTEEGKAFADFAALARNAYAIMLSRGWTAMHHPNGGWEAVDADLGVPVIDSLPSGFPGPFEAIVETAKDSRVAW